MLSTAQASLYTGFSESATRHPQQPALWVEGTTLSYDDLADRAARLARVIDTHAAEAPLVGLLANYTGFLAPKVALFSNIALMVAILLWRPRGLYPVTNR